MKRLPGYFEAVASAIGGLSDPAIERDIAAAAALLAQRQRWWSTGVGKSAQAARLFAEDMATLTLSGGFIHGGDLLHGGMGRIAAGDCIVFFSDGAQTHDLVQASRQMPSRHRILVTSNADPLIEAERVIRYRRPAEHPFGLPGATMLQVVIARCLAVTAAEQAQIQREQIDWAHPA
jgi:D-arabinose 5-phosphate isomerase GutQ